MFTLIWNLRETVRGCDWFTQDGLTALHCAARNGHVATITQLLKLHASVTSRTRRGLTALHLAVQGDHVQCVELLTQARNVNDVTNVCASDARSINNGLYYYYYYYL